MQQRKLPDVKSKKHKQLQEDHVPADVQKVKNDGESHVRSCIRQPVPVHPFRDLMPATTNEVLEERELPDGPKNGIYSLSNIVLRVIFMMSILFQKMRRSRSFSPSIHRL